MPVSHLHLTGVIPIAMLTALTRINLSFNIWCHRHKPQLLLLGGAKAQTYLKLNQNTFTTPHTFCICCPYVSIHLLCYYQIAIRTYYKACAAQMRSTIFKSRGEEGL